MESLTPPRRRRNRRERRGMRRILIERMGKMGRMIRSNDRVYRAHLLGL